MGDLADNFGGKVTGELIRASDWNGLIDGIEAQLAGLESRLGDRIDAIAPRLDTVETRLGAVETAIAPLTALATALLARQRRLDLSSTRTAFAVGERAEIVARVTDLLGQPLDLAVAANRPWIDFVTVWGTLKAAPGFQSVAGTGGRTVTVQVNNQGEARVLLRAEAAETLAEEQELEVSAVLGTTIGAATIASAFLTATTPGASDLVPAFAAVSAAYDSADTPVMRNYLDSVYLSQPARSFTRIAPSFVLNWHDEYATVLAFVKPDDSPGTADGAMAAGSVRVTFRDWVQPWLTGHYLPLDLLVVDGYRGRFAALQVNKEFEPAVSDIFDHVERRTRFRGLLGTQRELAAAQAAIASLPTANAPAFQSSVVNAVFGGLTVQQGLLYSQAVAPLIEESTAPARAIGMGAARGEAAAGVLGVKLRAETEARITEKVEFEGARISSDLKVSVAAVTNLANQARLDVGAMKADLGGKASFDLVTKLLQAGRNG
ncbi:MAG: hypothetical protein ACKVPY_07125 [Paracoccaceae bacterium]